METGTTAPLSPGQESDMSKVREIFDNAINAMVDATKLRQEVESIKSQLVAIQRDLDYYRSRNTELDTMLVDTRRQRDEADKGLVEARATIASLVNEKDQLEGRYALSQSEITSLRDSVAQAHKERDAHALEAMLLCDDLDKAQARIKEFEEFAARFALASKSEATQPAPTTEPTPKPPSRIYEDEPGYDSSLPHYYDLERQRYYHKI